MAVDDIPEIVGLSITWPSWEDESQEINALVTLCGLLESVHDSLEQQRNSAQQDVSQFNSIKQWWRGIKEASDKIVELDRIQNGLQKAFDIVHKKRVAFTQGILNDICQEADRLFQEIHPGENISLDQLKMEEERSGSVSQTGSFNSHTDIPPQAVFSESHLDTLGFCVWLALAKRESPEQTVLLIDDIFSSVDASHLRRVMDLMTAEGHNFLQVIMATHYRLLWNHTQTAQSIQRVKLGNWNVQNGIRAQNMPAVTEQLRQGLAEPVMDRQVVASKAGILLESILYGLSLHYERPLPCNLKNEYTLGALMSTCGKLFSKYNLAIEQNAKWETGNGDADWQAVDVTSAFNRVGELVFIRNQVGCHFNIDGMEIPDNDVRDFGTATIDLVEALTCPNCGSLATRTANDGTHLRCSCSKRAARMTPVAIQ